jgi:hypothetical protein
MGIQDGFLKIQLVNQLKMNKIKVYHKGDDEVEQNRNNQRDCQPD